jgi:bisphosphoglycerate-dependent phosphoglycerate mutase family 1
VCADIYSDYNIWLFRIDLRLNPQPLLFLCFFHFPIVRHGQSIWNKDNRFTAWMDVPLSRQGLDDAACAAMHLKPAGIRFDIAFTSVLQRAIKTCNTILEEIGQLWIPTVCDWQVPRISH